MLETNKPFSRKHSPMAASPSSEGGRLSPDEGDGVCLGTRQCTESISDNSRITLRAMRNSHSERNVATEGHQEDNRYHIFHFISCLLRDRCLPLPLPQPEHVYLKPCKCQFNTWISNYIMCL